MVGRVIAGKCGGSEARKERIVNRRSDHGGVSCAHFPYARRKSENDAVIMGLGR